MPRSLHALAAVCVVAAAVLAAAPARAQITLPLGFRDTLLAQSLVLPTGLAAIPDTTGTRLRMLVTEQKPRTLRLVTFAPTGAATLVGTVPDVEWIAGERGLLGAVLDPRWPSKPYVYVNYTAVGGKLHLARFTLSGDLTNTGNGLLTMNPATRMLVLNDVPDSLNNHNGGAVRFGPDGMLYLSTGEDQRQCLAQDTTSLAGKLLRLDVRALPDTGAGPVPRALITPADNPRASSPDSNFRLVYAMGFRNPFRFHVDSADGAVFVADVGHQTWEEINRVTGFGNYGWPWREGTSGFSSCPGQAQPATVSPILQMPHGGWLSIVSLGIYRTPPGATAPFPADYEGDLLFGDYYGGIVRRASLQGASWAIEPTFGQPTAEDWGTDASSIVDALVARDGSWWYVRQTLDGGFTSGVVRRVWWTGLGDTVLAAPASAAGVRFEPPAPNPARGGARLVFTLAGAAAVELHVHDAAGRLVRTLARGTREAGRHVVAWDGLDRDGRPAPAGLYFARLTGGGVPLVRRIALAR